VSVPAFHLNTATTVGAGQTISTAASGGVGYLVDQGPVGPNFTNLGDIAFTQAADQSGATAFQLLAGSGISWTNATVDNEGRIAVTSQGSAAFLLGDSEPAITNGGVIAITASGLAEGVDVSPHQLVFAPDFAQTVTNSGQITVSGGSAATGLFLGDGGLVNNSGSISVTGSAPGAAVHGVWSQFSIILQNTGVITATDTDPSVDSVAVHFAGGSGHIDNQGTITGDIAIEDINPGQVDSQFDGIGNEGVINGRIVIDHGGSANVHVTVLNNGTINGDVDLGPGAQSFFGQNGVQNGLVSGGPGDDLIFGGPSRDSLQGNQGDDTLHGGAGDDIVVGGKDNDQQFGDDGDDIVWGNLGNDTLDGGNGNDQVRGGQGDDSLSGGAGNDFISGDRGNDTETGGAGADTFHTFSGAGIDKVLDFNLAEGDRVMVDPGTVFTVHQVGSDTVIDMGNGDQMILVGVQASTLTGSWIFGA
jgi:Ca2+-binding RTX toxin-like protein